MSQVYSKYGLITLGLAVSPTVSTLVPNENPEKIFGLAAELSVDFSSGLS